jgi:hypothetical protein
MEYQHVTSSWLRRWMNSSNPPINQDQLVVYVKLVSCSFTPLFLLVRGFSVVFSRLFRPLSVFIFVPAQLLARYLPRFWHLSSALCCVSRKARKCHAHACKLPPTECHILFSASSMLNFLHACLLWAEVVGFFGFPAKN